MKRNNFPKTYFLFPVGVGHDDHVINSKVNLKKGVALILAILVISMMMIFSTDLILSSQVNLELAVAQRDDVKAEYMAKSAQNLALFLLSSDFALDLFLASPQSPLKTPPNDGVGDIWNLLNGMPIGGGTLELLGLMQKQFDLSAVNDSETIKQINLFDGQFILNIEDESSKINLNYCSEGTCKEILLMLEALMSCPAEAQYLEVKNINPKELVYKIKDYIDEGDKPEEQTGLGDENDPYQRKKPPYKTKNAPFETLSELKMVDGWDDELFTIFSPYLTVYPFKERGLDRHKVNLNTASRELLGCLFPEAKIDCKEKFAIGLSQKNEDKTNLITSDNQVNQILQDMFCYNKNSDQTSGTERVNWFSNRSSTFKIIAKGEVGDQTKVLELFIQRVVPDVKKNKNASYDILYWKML